MKSHSGECHWTSQMTSHHNCVKQANSGGNFDPSSVICRIVFSQWLLYICHPWVMPTCQMATINGSSQVVCKLDTIWVVYISPIGNGFIRLVLHSMVCGTSPNSLGLILIKINVPALEGNFVKKLPQLVALQIFKVHISIMENHWAIMFYYIIIRLKLNMFFKALHISRKTTKFGSQNLATKFGFVPDMMTEGFDWASRTWGVSLVLVMPTWYSCGPCWHRLLISWSDNFPSGWRAFRMIHFRYVNNYLILIYYFNVRLKQGCICYILTLWHYNIWWWWSSTMLVQVMACCLLTPSYYQIQCWLIIYEHQRNNPHAILGGIFQ